MYYLSVYIHILAAIFWLGGMLFTVAVLVPLTRKPLLREKRGAFFTLIGKQFSRISWILFLVLLVTGFTNLLARGYTFSHLATADFWHSHLGGLLQIKLLLFGLILMVSGFHDFYAGPKAARMMDQKPDDRKTRLFRKLSSWAGRVNFLLGLLILYYAMKLARL